MGKLMPVIFLSGMSVMAVMAWSNISDYNKEKDALYNNCIARAEAYESKEIYIDAVHEYAKALEMRPSYDTAIHIADLYGKLDRSDFERNYLNKAIELDPTKPEPYQRIYDICVANATDGATYKIIMQAKENGVATDEMNKKLKTLLNKYDTRGNYYDEFRPWHYKSGESVGNAVVIDNGKYGIVDSNFEEFFACKYEYLGLPEDGVIPVTVDGDSYYMNYSGYKKLVPNEKAEYLGSFSNNYAPAKINGVYGYLDKNMKEYHFEYDYAGEFYNGLAAVEKNGRWAVINTSFTEITAYDYDEIVMDSYGFCAFSGVFFAKQGDKYYLCNNLGTVVSVGFDDVKLFASDAPAAVKVGKKWGFVDKNGNIVIEPMYDDADSFNQGFAPVKDGNVWSFITSDGTKVVDTECKSLSALYNNGYAFANDGERDSFVKIRKYE